MLLEHPTLSRRALAAALCLSLGALSAVLALSGCSSSNPAGPTLGETYVVDPAGGGDFLTIQEGLNAASDGDTVLVATGTYTGDGNKDLTFGGLSPVLKGTGERNEVVIDCEGEGRGFFIDGGASPVIENLMVTNGSAPRGGGMYIQGASPTLSNVRFVYNNATVGSGGGVYCRNGSPALADVLFDDNTAAFDGGGGMHCVDSAPALARVTFLRNASGGSGGGMSCVDSPAAISECVFFRNSSVFGGALFCTWSRPSVDSCTFVDNEGEFGSAICCLDQSTPPISNTIIAFNTPGEGLYCSVSLPTTHLSCVYANGEFNELCGNYTTSILYEDPLFCDLAGGDLTLAADSPCLPANNDWGVHMGALGEGCR